MLPGPPKLGITITEWKREEKEEISLFGNGRVPPWSSAALDHLPGAGCRTTAQPESKSDHYFWDVDGAEILRAFNSRLSHNFDCKVLQHTLGSV